MILTYNRFIAYDYYIITPSSRASDIPNLHSYSINLFPFSSLFIASTLVQLCGVNEFADRQLQNQSRILIRNERG